MFVFPNAATIRDYPAGLALFPPELFPAECFVGGVKVSRAFAYNIAEGWVLADAVDEAGNILIGDDGEIATVKFSGVVRIELLGDAA